MGKARADIEASMQQERLCDPISATLQCRSASVSPIMTYIRAPEICSLAWLAQEGALH
jgi:hypothetical protein